ncbi:hypothetical protein GIR35_12410 [Enterococcus faecalis]|nr:hypothetical protein GIR35_12410 [Enterococcus faecalis]
MNKKPKERIIYDEDLFLNEDDEEWALYDAMHDYLEEQLAALLFFFDGEKPGVSSTIDTHNNNPFVGNPVIARGSVGRWDGIHHGMTVYDDLSAALDTSPSRYGGANVFADCEISKVWDKNGHLFIRGTHHDGSVTVEIRQLTDDGAESYEQISNSWIGDSFTMAGKTYDGSEQSVLQAMRDLWKEPSFCQIPHFMEHEVGCHSEEEFENKSSLPQLEREAQRKGHQMFNFDDDCRILGSDEHGTLYSVYIPSVVQEVSVYVDNDGKEFVTTDMQGPQPQSIEEMYDFDWYAPVEEGAYSAEMSNLKKAKEKVVDERGADSARNACVCLKDAARESHEASRQLASDDRGGDAAEREK